MESKSFLEISASTIYAELNYKKMLDHNIYDMEITKKDTPELFDKLLQISDVYKYSVNGNKIHTNLS